MTLLAGEAAFLFEIKIKLRLENSLGSRTQNTVWYRECFYVLGLRAVKLQLPNVRVQGDSVACRRYLLEFLLRRVELW